METLLRNNLTAHYGLQVANINNIAVQTNEQYFEIEDDANREIQIHLAVGMGMAAYSNTRSYEIAIINYDKFLTSLPATFTHGRQRCDLIVYTINSKQYFLLNELKDRPAKPKIRNGAIKQLIASLNCIMAVPDIKSFANTFTIRRCCYFNKQAVPPPGINAPVAFNRFSQIAPNGLHMTNADIEQHGFQFYEYTGNHVFTMT